MSRGGARVGRQGKAYPQRTDLNANPERTAALPPTMPAEPQQAPLPQRDYVRPDEIPTLTAPTQRPNEPVTAGIDYGPGPGAPEIPLMGSDQTGITLRLLYQASGSEAIRRLLAAHERGL